MAPRASAACMDRGDAVNARHLSKTAEHNTPGPIVRASRDVLGSIDLDPASNAEANETVQATTIYTSEDDGLKQEWRGNVFLNPPGTCGLVVCGNPKSCTCRLVPRFWSKLIESHLSGAVPSAIWIGYSLDQLQSLQSDTLPGPLGLPICVPRKRLAFRGSSPTHGNYITLLTTNDMQRRIFANRLRRFGEIRL